MNRYTKGCNVAGCDRPHEARGMCSMHYKRWLRHGSTEKLAGGGGGKPKGRLCDIAGCGRKHMAHGMCSMHYRRVRDHGTTELLPREPQPRMRDWYAEEVAFLTKQGVSPLRIPDRIGIKPGSLARALYRAERPDLARLFKRADVRDERRSA